MLQREIAGGVSSAALCEGPMACVVTCTDVTLGLSVRVGWVSFPGA